MIDVLEQVAIYRSLLDTISPGPSEHRTAIERKLRDVEAKVDQNELQSSERNKRRKLEQEQEDEIFAWTLEMQEKGSNTSENFDYETIDLTEQIENDAALARELADEEGARPAQSAPPAPYLGATPKLEHDSNAVQPDGSVNVIAGTIPAFTIVGTDTVGPNNATANTEAPNTLSMTDQDLANFFMTIEDRVSKVYGKKEVRPLHFVRGPFNLFKRSALENLKKRGLDYLVQDTDNEIAQTYEGSISLTMQRLEAAEWQQVLYRNLRRKTQPTPALPMDEPKTANAEPVQPQAPAPTPAGISEQRLMELRIAADAKLLRIHGPPQLFTGSMLTSYEKLRKAYRDEAIMNEKVNALKNIEPAQNTLWPDSMAAGPSTTASIGLPSSYYDYSHSYSMRFDAEKNREDLKKLIESIQPDADIEPHARRGTPSAMTFVLMEHQKVGLTWMRRMEEGNNKGGLLADDMGLGKTIQALALILSHQPEDPSIKTTLIVAPLALLKQWHREIESKIKPMYAQKVCIYHSIGRRNMTWVDLRKYDIVLTTYGMIASDYKAQVKWEADVKVDARNEVYKPESPLLDKDSQFHRIILDEAQMIKNRNALASRGVAILHAKYRWGLSGTPAQNNIDEFYAIIRFLRVRPFCDWDEFRTQLSNAARSRDLKRVDKSTRLLQGVLRAIMLRRTKDSKIDGESILDLPPKTIEETHVVFNVDQQAFYNNLEHKSQMLMNRYEQNNTIGKNYANILVLLLRLRQACCHPHLIPDTGTSTGISYEAGVVPKSAEEMEAMARQMPSDVVNRLKNDKEMLCPVCWDTPTDMKIILFCGHYGCGECVNKLFTLQTQVNQSHDELEPALCPTCRSAMSSDKLLGFNLFKKVHMPEALTPEPQPEAVKDESSAVGGSGTKGKEKAVIPEREETPLEDLAPRQRILRRLKKDWISSAKIDKCLEILETVKARDPTEKTVVFSQFILLLDFLEIPLADMGFKWKRYEGSMSAVARDDAVLDFMKSPDINIMLVSLKAGNVGLNLTCASQCIVMDPFWNPFVELQAIDRTHRIGQSRPVCVHRICVAGTVEDRILELQNQKQELIETALDDQAAKSIQRLSPRELMYLFGINDPNSQNSQNNQHI